MTYKRLWTGMMAAVATAAAWGLTGDWSGNLDFGVAGKLALVLHFSLEGTSMDSPDQGAYGIPAETLYNENDSVAIAVPKIGFKFAGKANGDTMTGAVTQGGKSFPITLTLGKDTGPKRPQTPQPPYPYTTEEMTVQAPAATLTGTLTLPDAPKDSPVVVMVSGSGLQDRDETLFQHKPFAVLADRLARAGIPSLRYDDRGAGASTGDPSKATTADFAEDAAAVVDRLHSLGYSRVGILGHSEGGSIAFINAAKGKADFIITLGAPGVKGDSILVEQVNALAPGTRMTVEKYRAARPWGDNVWMEYFVNYDPAADIAATHVPALVMGGEKDVQVNPATNISRIREYLPSGDHNSIIIYPSLNHLMQNCRTGLPSEYGEIETTIDEQVLTDIINWIKSLFNNSY